MITNYECVSIQIKALTRLLKFGAGIEIQINDKKACDHYGKLQSNHSFCFCQGTAKTDSTVSYLSATPLCLNVF